MSSVEVLGQACRNAARVAGVVADGLWGYGQLQIDAALDQFAQQAIDLVALCTGLARHELPYRRAQLAQVARDIDVVGAGDAGAKQTLQVARVEVAQIQ